MQETRANLDRKHMKPFPIFEKAASPSQHRESQRLHSQTISTSIQGSSRNIQQQLFNVPLGQKLKFISKIAAVYQLVGHSSPQSPGLVGLF